MDNFHSQYEDVAKDILQNGKRKINRTGTDTVAVFGRMMRFNLSAGEFPLITSKKVFTRGIFEELKWFIKGETNIKSLVDKGVHIWDAWATSEGNVGPIYGEIWRRFPVGIPVEVLKRIYHDHSGSQDELMGKLKNLIEMSEYKPIDQLKNLLVDLQERPYSRRHLVTAWAPSVLPNERVNPQQNVLNGKQSLAACHTFFQLYVEDMTFEEARDYRDAAYIRLINAIEYDIEKLKEKILNIQSLPDDEYEKKKQEETDARKKAAELELKCLEARMEYDEFREAIELAETDVSYQPSLLPRKRLSMMMYQRSADFPLGIPFNIASYAALLQLIAIKSGMMPGDFIHSIGDCHVYVDQIDLLKEQISRETYPYPTLTITGTDDSLDWSDVDKYEFNVYGYKCHPAIKYPGAAV